MRRVSFLPTVHHCGIDLHVSFSIRKASVANVVLILIVKLNGCRSCFHLRMERSISLDG